MVSQTENVALPYLNSYESGTLYLMDNLTVTTLRAYSADYYLVIFFFLFFPENRFRMSNPVLLEK